MGGKICLLIWVGGDRSRVGKVALVDLARGKSEVLTTTKLEYYQPATPHRSPKAIVMSISDRIDPSTATQFISWFDWHILKYQSELRIRTNLAPYLGCCCSLRRPKTHLLVGFLGLNLGLCWLKNGTFRILREFENCKFIHWHSCLQQKKTQPRSFLRIPCHVPNKHS